MLIRSAQKIPEASSPLARGTSTDEVKVNLNVPYHGKPTGYRWSGAAQGNWKKRGSARPTTSWEAMAGQTRLSAGAAGQTRGLPTAPVPRGARRRCGRSSRPPAPSTLAAAASIRQRPSRIHDRSLPRPRRGPWASARLVPRRDPSPMETPCWGASPCTALRRARPTRRGLCLLSRNLSFRVTRLLSY